MRAGWTTIQQTLTTEAVDVLNQSIAEAARRSHAQTTPLHVAATLLVSPTGCLRQACVRSQSNSLHPLQCRALELCFSVALDRLPCRKQTGRTVSVPPISNALMAALKRAQANQRKGCTEQMQQHLPMMAVKVEVEQLIVSILDDPSVCRVMKEARFSSPTVKSVIEQSNVSVSPCSSSSPTSSAVSSPITSFFSSSVGLGFQKSTTLLPTKKTFYINPRLLSPEQTWTPSIPPTKLSRGNGIGILSSSVESLLSSRTTDPSRETSCRPGQKTLVQKPPQPVLSSSKTRFFHSNDVPMTTVQKPYYFPPVSLVETDLALGRSAKENHENHIKDQSECTDDFFFFSGQQLEKSSGDFDSESFKKLFKGLTEKISWQPEAASAVAITVTRFKSGPGISALRKKSDTWILFLGPDKVGKKKMASSLSELLFGNDPTTVTLGGTEIRKRTALDRIAEAVWRNPFSVFVIENVDQADTLVRFKIKQAIESGRITDSNGREVSLGSAIFILTADSSPSAAASLESGVRENTKKRHRSEWLSSDVNGKGKSRTVLQEPKLTLDLHLGNPSGDPTVENVNEDRYGLLMMKRPSSTLPMDMIRAVDDVINFKAVDLGSLLARSPSPVKDGIRSR